MNTLHCSVCGKELSGGLDTYGDPDQPLCYEDYFYPPDAEPETPPWQDDIEATEGLLEALRLDLDNAYDDDLTPYQRLELEVDINVNESLLAQYRRWQADSIIRRKEKAAERLARWSAQASS